MLVVFFFFFIALVRMSWNWCIERIFPHFDIFFLSNFCVVCIRVTLTPHLSSPAHSFSNYLHREAFEFYMHVRRKSYACEYAEVQNFFARDFVIHPLSGTSVSLMYANVYFFRTLVISSRFGIRLHRILLHTHITSECEILKWRWSDGI